MVLSKGSKFTLLHVGFQFPNTIWGNSTLTEWSCTLVENNVATYVKFFF